MKQGYILLFTLIMLMFISVLISSLTFVSLTAGSLENRFYADQKKLLADYSAKKIGLTESVELHDANHRIVTTNVN